MDRVRSSELDPDSSDSPLPDSDPEAVDGDCEEELDEGADVGDFEGFAEVAKGFNDNSREPERVA